MIAIPLFCSGAFLLFASWILTLIVDQADARANWEPYWVGAMVSMILGGVLVILALATMPVPKG